MRVVHVAQPTTEGVARCVVGLVRHQAAAGVDVAVVCPDEGWLAAEAKDAGARHVTWTATRSPGPEVPGETRRLRRVVRALQPDVLHLHSSKAGLSGRLAVRGAVPTVFQPHAWSFLAVRGPVHAATLAWERIAVRWCHRVVCVSDAERQDGAAAGIPMQRTCVVPNGVDVDWFRPRDRATARRRLQLDDGPLAVCVGRLSEQKGQDVLLRAWPAVAQRAVGSVLTLVGDGPWREQLHALAPDGVRFAGNSIDPRDWYAAADVVVMPSRWEGMALVPLEAGASGRSVVMSDVAGAREAVPAGAGAVVGREDVEALAAALAERLQDRARADLEGAAARRHVADRYSLTVQAERMQAVYEELQRIPLQR
jgi:glycosyltransferase involved in cell wall biosynthesis